MRKVMWLCTLSLSVITAGCGDSTKGAERAVESAAERFIGYTPQRLSEYKTAVECATVVTQFEAQRDVINTICGAIFSESIATEPDFRKNLLCLRHGLEKAGDFQQAREIVGTCAKDFPSPKSSRYASILMVDKFPTVEQQKINQLKAQNERLEESQRQEAQARRMREIDQDYNNRMNQINQDYANRAAENNANYQRLMDRQNRAFSCQITGNTVNCN